MRLATIDLGTNTVRRRVADMAAAVGWTTVVQDQRVTRLGEGLRASGRLAETPMNRTAATVTEYARRAREAGAGALRIIATSAVRDAANGREFAIAVERASGQAVEIVSGEEEARLTIRGIVAGLGTAEGRQLALDLGLRSYDAERVQGHRLSRAAIEKLRDRLCVLTQDERGRLPCLEPGRADLIVPGVAIVLASLDVTRTDAVVVSDWGLREGIMAETIERLS